MLGKRVSLGDEVTEFKSRNHGSKFIGGGIGREKGKKEDPPRNREVLIMALFLGRRLSCTLGLGFGCKKTRGEMGGASRAMNCRVESGNGGGNANN